MTALFIPPKPEPRTLIESVDSLIVDTLAHALTVDGVDLNDERACRAAIIGMGQTPTFTDDYLSTIRLAALISISGAQPAATPRS